MPGGTVDDPVTRLAGHGGEPARVRLNPGGHYVTRNGGEVIVTVLGSCVAACIRDPVARVGGMNHFMLPESGDGAWGAASASLRFGNFAMERLINDILCRGGRRSNLEIKVFGGASMLRGGAMVGPRNADFVETYLNAEGLPILAADLRGAHPRRIEYTPGTGRVRMLELVRDDAAIGELEQSYGARLTHEPARGSIELFD